MRERERETGGEAKEKQKQQCKACMDASEAGEKGPMRRDAEASSKGLAPGTITFPGMK